MEKRREVEKPSMEWSRAMRSGPTPSLGNFDFVEVTLPSQNEIHIEYNLPTNIIPGK